MRLKTMAQSAAQRILCLNYYITFTVVQSSSQIWAASVIYKNLPKVNNQENSPNLVTLDAAAPDE
jgi:hypothetical protein